MKGLPFAGSNETANKIKTQNKFVNVKFELRITGPPVRLLT